MDNIVKDIMRKDNSAEERKRRIKERETKERRLKNIDVMMMKMYNDNVEGKIDDTTLSAMVEQLQKEAAAIKKALESAKSEEDEKLIKFENYKKFFELTKRFSKIEELDRDTLITFIERIEVGPKILPEGYTRATHTNSPYVQSVKIYYKFIGAAEELQK
jgi:hypothetical protein